jgi:hypothetical protein
MNKRLLLLLPGFALILGSNCDKTETPDEPPPPDASPYCYGTAPLTKRIGDDLSAVYNAIMGGQASADRRATLQVRMTNGMCTGVALDAYTALTAAHCTNGSFDVTAVVGTEPGYFKAVRVIEHPDYATDWHSDLAILKFDKPLPGPYVDQIFDPENPEHASRCVSGVAQGWGRWEGTELSLRETEYDIDRVTEKLVITDNEWGEGRICFGDSGGPFYAEMEDGQLWLVGNARTTGSLDCTIESTHVRASAFADWIEANR